MDCVFFMGLIDWIDGFFCRSCDHSRSSCGGVDGFDHNGAFSFPCHVSYLLSNTDNGCSSLSSIFIDFGLWIAELKFMSLWMLMLINYGWDALPVPSRDNGGGLGIRKGIWRLKLFQF